MEKISGFSGISGKTTLRVGKPYGNTSSGLSAVSSGFSGYTTLQVGRRIDATETGQLFFSGFSDNTTLQVKASY